mmetsp:Transcript_15592/g.36817  ORF Transcript_15592/g.36817 Transcript_15592/m.36817 type:complete len:202 (+) Transcript_15592:691-1296(+)
MHRCCPRVVPRRVICLALCPAHPPHSATGSRHPADQTGSSASAYSSALCGSGVQPGRVLFPGRVRVCGAGEAVLGWTHAGQEAQLQHLHQRDVFAVSGAHGRGVDAGHVPRHGGQLHRPPHQDRAHARWLHVGVLRHLLCLRHLRGEEPADCVHPRVSRHRGKMHGLQGQKRPYQELQASKDLLVVGSQTRRTWFRQPAPV